jgi:hypothetical protein
MHVVRSPRDTSTASASVSLEPSIWYASELHMKCPHGVARRQEFYPTGAVFVFILILHLGYYPRSKDGVVSAGFIIRGLYKRMKKEFSPFQDRSLGITSPCQTKFLPRRRIAKLGKMSVTMAVQRRVKL